MNHPDSPQACRQCSLAFNILDEDKAMLKELSPEIGGRKMDLPLPTLCPDCRQQRRMAHENQLNLYERKCDFSGASIVSNIHPSSPYVMYRQEDWYTDKWDPLEYGRVFDFSRPFFEQWNELQSAVPRPSLVTGYEFDENCDYTNYAGKNKNCYLLFDSDEDRDCYYSHGLNQCTNCVDCFRTRKSELCYECVDCVRCYSSAFLQDCDNCSDSLFLKNCTGCKNCLMCSNLRNKEFHVDNKPVSEEQFKEFRSKLNSYSAIQSAMRHFEQLKLEYPQKFMHGVQNENVIGDYLVNCKNALYCFDTEDCWGGRYVFQGFMPLKTCMDIMECGDAERLFECSVCGYGAYNCHFTTHVLGSPSDLLYCGLSNHSKNCFGCVGVRSKQYCILNKQYTKEEYEALVPKIIEHMRETKEWGEFFPVSIAVPAYNETLAQDYFPLTREQALKLGWKWLDDADRRNQYMGPKIELPDTTDEVADDICKKILTCEESGKQYKIIPQELAFYRQMNLPLPRRAFFQRHKDRMALRNPRKLYDRQCDKCSKAIQTTYAPDRPEKVYCEECYLTYFK